MLEIIKVCGIVEPADALAAVQAGATAIGIVFYSASPRYARLDQAAMVSAIVSSRALKVGVFVNEAPERIRAVADAVRLDVVQLHGDEPPSDIAELGGLRVWKALPVGDDFDPAWMDDYDCEAILLDNAKADAYGGSGQTFPWGKAVAANGKRRIIVAGGLGPDNVQEVIRTVAPWGVDASSRLESSPGRKDAEKVEAYVKAAQKRAELEFPQ
jgi:phosphoribosylanthranilate isomerase